MAMPATCILAIDHGRARIGLAISDPDRKFSFPLETYFPRDKPKDQEFYAETIQENRVGLLLLGLPLHLNGILSSQAIEVQNFGTWIKQISGLPLIYWDERFTSVEAEKVLWDAGLTHKQRKARRDKLAAQIMLQAYLEAGCPEKGVAEGDRL